MLNLIDLSATFDTVDHQILSERLSDEVGIRGTALNWFRSYLSHRSQRVSVHGVISRPFDLNCGVPQGSYLGPLHPSCLSSWNIIFPMLIVSQTIL